MTRKSHSKKLKNRHKLTQLLTIMFEIRDEICNYSFLQNNYLTVTDGTVEEEGYGKT